MQTNTNIAIVIDALGTLKAQIADLERQEKSLRDQIIELGSGAHEGKLFKVSVVTVERATLDMKAVRAKLSPQFIRANTSIIEVTSVRVTAR